MAAASAGSSTRAGGRLGPVIKLLRDALALPRSKHVDLAQLDGAGRRFDWKVGRPELGEADRLAVHLGDAQGEGGVGDFLRKSLRRHSGEEGVEVLRLIKMGERLDEAAREQARDRRSVIARDIARSHGGDITLGDSPLGGLRATVRIPV